MWMLWLCVAFMRVAPFHPFCLLSSPEQYGRFLETSRKFTCSQKALKRVWVAAVLKSNLQFEEVLQMKGLNQFNTSSGSFCSENTAQVVKWLLGLMGFLVLDSKRFHTWPPGRTNQKPRANQRLWPLFFITLRKALLASHLYSLIPVTVFLCSHTNITSH